MMSASDRRRLALCGRLSPPRIAPATIWTDRGNGFPGSGTNPDAHQAPHVRHRPAPVLYSPRSLSVGADKTRPGGWLCTVNKTASQRNPDDLRLLPGLAARYGINRKAFPPPGRNRSRTIRQRECKDDGTRFGGWGKDWGIFWEFVLLAISPPLVGKTSAWWPEARNQ